MMVFNCSQRIRVCFTETKCYKSYFRISTHKTKYYLNTNNQKMPQNIEQQVTK